MISRHLIFCETFIAWTLAGPVNFKNDSLLRVDDSGQIWSNFIATSHDRTGPQKVGKRKGHPLISGKSRLVKYDNLAR